MHPNEARACICMCKPSTTVVWKPNRTPYCHIVKTALTRRIAWRRSEGGVGLGPSGKQLHPATPELTAWREGPADSSQ